MTTSWVFRVTRPAPPRPAPPLLGQVCEYINRGMGGFGFIFKTSNRVWAEVGFCNNPSRLQYTNKTPYKYFSLFSGFSHLLK